MDKKKYDREIKRKRARKRWLVERDKRGREGERETERDREVC